MYSAIKVQGQPLYKLARQGIEIERQSRQVTIHSLEFESFIDTSVTFAVHCTKGTYVRTLVEDVGKVLGCGAYVSQLHRTAVAPYEQATMYSMETLEAACEADGQDAPALLFASFRKLGPRYSRDQIIDRHCILFAHRPNRYGTPHSRAKAWSDCSQNKTNLWGLAS